MNLPDPLTGTDVRDALLDARRFTLALCEDLTDEPVDFADKVAVQTQVSVSNKTRMRQNWLVRGG